MKRIALILLSLVMVFSTLVIVPVSAAGSAPEVVFKTDFEKVAPSLDDENVWTAAEYVKAVNALDGEALKGCKYVAISSAEDWNSIAAASSSTGTKAGYTFERIFFLTADLNFGGKAPSVWGVFYHTDDKNGKISGTTMLPFQGTLEGNGYSIQNAVISKDCSITYPTTAGGGVAANASIGLFAAARNATIKNLVIDSSCSFEATKGDALNVTGVGALIGTVNHGTITISNVWNKANVTSAGCAAGGLIGNAIPWTGSINVKIDNCINDGTVTGAQATGGLVGAMMLRDGSANTTSATVTNSVNNGAIVGANADMTNGILGFANAKTTATFTNCANTADFGQEGDLDSLKGIVNYADSTILENVTMNNCYDKGAEVHWDKANYDAVVGYREDLVVEADLNGVPNINDYEANTDAAAFQITDATGLNKLSALVASGLEFNGKTIYLANDINMTGVAFTPIGHYTHEKAKSNGALGGSPKTFKGTFDGQGHMIDGIQVSYTTTQRSDVGLFGYAAGGTVKNTVLGPSCYFELIGGGDGYCGAGAFVGKSGKLYNCASYATVNAQTDNAAGGIGREAQSLEFVSNYGTVVNTGGNAGGIGGFASAANAIHYCVNYGVIKGGQTAGIAIGGNQNVADTRGCVNYGTVLTRSGSNSSGGIVVARDGKNVNLTSCANYGHVGRTSVVAGGNSAGLCATESGTANLNALGCTDAAFVGYNAATAGNADLKFVPDITSIYEIKDGTFGVIGGQTEAKIMKISNAAGMRLLSAYVNVYDTNKGAGKTFYLANDIDMSGYASVYTVNGVLTTENGFAPIGWTTVNNTGMLGQACGFKGTFNGMGHAIKNLTMNTGSGNDHAGHIGLFGRMQSGYVSNLVMDSSCKVINSTGQYTVYGMIVNTAYDTVITNVWNQVEVGNMNTRLASGIVGYSISSQITNATNSGAVTGAEMVGGILAIAQNGQSTIANCRNTGAITGPHNEFKQYVGSIVGSVEIDVLLVNCENYATVKTGTVALPGELAGIVTSTGKLSYDNCYNYGELESDKADDRTDKLAGAVVGACAPNDALTTATGADTAYAEEMLKVWFQTNNEGDVRLVTTVDSLVYDKIVLTITYEGQTKDVVLTGVYTSILAGEIDKPVDDPATYGADTSLYFAALTITGAAGKTFTVQASAYIGDTAVLTGAARTVVVD